MVQGSKVKSRRWNGAFVEKMEKPKTGVVPMERAEAEAMLLKVMAGEGRRPAGYSRAYDGLTRSTATVFISKLVSASGPVLSDKLTRIMLKEYGEDGERGAVPKTEIKRRWKGLV